jgi:hypothetical protein
MGHGNQFNLSLVPKSYYIVMIGTQTYVTVPQHGPVSLYNKLEGLSISKQYSYFPRHGLWMNFMGS